MTNKYSVFYVDSYNRSSYIHVFAESAAHAREIVETDGVGYENNRVNHVKRIIVVEEIKTDKF